MGKYPEIFPSEDAVVDTPALTDAELRATPVPVSGPLTDGELRATPLPVSGPLTDAQLRAAALIISQLNDLTFVTATIAAGASLASAVDIGAGRVLVGAIYPAGWTTAATTFKAASSLAGTYNMVKDINGAELTISSCAASEYRVVGDKLANFRGLRFIQLRSGTNATPVVQSSEVVVTLITASM